MTKKQVVIVGMGFGGIRAARVLAGKGHDVLLVDRNNYHLFQPLLHLYYLIGFRNRIVVMLNWVWYYWFHERQVRLITRREAGQTSKKTDRNSTGQA